MQEPKSKLYALATAGILAASVGVWPAAAQNANADKAAASKMAKAETTGSVAPSGATSSRRAGIVGFVEFVARDDVPGGHAYIRYGRYDSEGRRVGVKYSGLYPKYGWAGKVLGGILPVAATTNAVAEDKKLRPIAIYRRQLTASQFAKLRAKARDMHANHAFWNAFLHNCHAFIGQYAAAIGLKTPLNTLTTSSAYIAALKAANGS